MWYSNDRFVGGGGTSNSRQKKKKNNDTCLQADETARDPVQKSPRITPNGTFDSLKNACIFFFFIFAGLTGDNFHFDSNGDGPARYNIIHFKQMEPGTFKWIKVGVYSDGNLRLNTTGTYKLKAHRRDFNNFRLFFFFSSQIPRHKNVIMLSR